jgi:hypothetical protein
MTITEARASIGRPVVYRPGTDAAREGVIAWQGSVATRVLFAGDEHPVPVHPADLALLVPDDRGEGGSG